MCFTLLSKLLCASTFHLPEKANFIEKNKSKDLLFFMAELSKKDPPRRRRSREKVVVSQRRHECACKRIADANVPFREKGGARKRADVFLHKKNGAKRTLLRRGASEGSRTLGLQSHNLAL